MASPFKAAKRQARKLRVALDGPSGAGKTYTTLRLAFSLKAAGLCSKIAVIDTEHESASLYEGESPDGERWEFDVLPLSQFSPTQFTWAVKEATKAGYDCVVVDSLSHAWIGEGGALDQVDKKGGNSFTAWKDITPLHREMVDTLIRCPAHVIVTMRSKVEYVLTEETNKAGKKIMVPKKIGMAPIQRDGLEYEFDLYGCLDQTNQIRISKTRCSLMNQKTSDKPGPAFWQPLFDWLSSAAPATPVSDDTPPHPLAETQQQTFERLAKLIAAAADKDALKAAGGQIATETSKLTGEQVKELQSRFAARKAVLSKSEPVTPAAAPPSDAAAEPVQPAAS